MNAIIFDYFKIEPRPNNDGWKVVRRVLNPKDGSDEVRWRSEGHKPFAKLERAIEYVMREETKILATKNQLGVERDAGWERTLRMLIDTIDAKYNMYAKALALAAKANGTIG